MQENWGYADWVPMQNDWAPMLEDGVPMQKHTDPLMEVVPPPKKQTSAKPRDAIPKPIVAHYKVNKYLNENQNSGDQAHDEVLSLNSDLQTS